MKSQTLRFVFAVMFLIIFSPIENRVSAQNKDCPSYELKTGDNVMSLRVFIGDKLVHTESYPMSGNFFDCYGVDMVTASEFIDPDEFNMQIAVISKIRMDLSVLNKKIYDAKMRLAKLRYQKGKAKEIYEAEVNLIKLENDAESKKNDIVMLTESVLSKISNALKEH
jgi:glycine/serine hydroxymethyltransferase